MQVLEPFFRFQSFCFAFEEKLVLCLCPSIKCSPSTWYPIEKKNKSYGDFNASFGDGHKQSILNL